MISRFILPGDLFKKNQLGFACTKNDLAGLVLLLKVSVLPCHWAGPLNDGLGSGIPYPNG